MAQEQLQCITQATGGTHQGAEALAQEVASAWTSEKSGVELMAVIDASVYIALINAHEGEHSSSWAWFDQARPTDEALVAPVILLPEVSAALSRGIGDPTLAHRAVQQLGRVDIWLFPSGAR